VKWKSISVNAFKTFCLDRLFGAVMVNLWRFFSWNILLTVSWWNTFDYSIQLNDILQKNHFAISGHHYFTFPLCHKYWKNYIEVIAGSFVIVSSHFEPLVESIFLNFKIYFTIISETNLNRNPKLFTNSFIKLEIRYLYKLYVLFK